MVIYIDIRISLFYIFGLIERDYEFFCFILIHVCSALDLRNRLLEFERTSAQRTRVYDDSTDWFSESTNIWLSHSDRERASVMAEDIEKKKRDAKSEFICIMLSLLS